LGRHNPVGKSKNVVGERGRKGSNYTTTTTSEKIKINFVLLFLVVSFSLCDLIVMEHTALPWKMPFQLSLWRMKPQTVDITSRDFLAEHYLIITEKINKKRWKNKNQLAVV
jgi:hypothetical protein